MVRTMPLMLQNIPTHVIAGPLGAGKTSLIKHLLAQRPANERWAVLINEFGQIGLDAALLTQDDDGIALGEVAGGCLCCVNGAPFQVGLGRLLRKAKPDRLFIEPSGLGHPAQLLKQLREAPWQNVLAVQPCVLVLDAQALAAGKPLPVAQQEALTSAGLLVLNKEEALDAAQRRAIEQQIPDCPLYWTRQAQVPLEQLPGLNAQAAAAVDNVDVPRGLAQMPAIWSDPAQPICLSRPKRAAGASAGAGTQACNSMRNACSVGWQALGGAAPSWLSTVPKAGFRPTRWTTVRSPGSPASGGVTHVSN